MSNTSEHIEWTFSSRMGYERTTQLWLYWEVHCDPMSDDYDPAEITPEELWRLWRRRYPRDDEAERVYGPGAYGISWYVGGNATFESAPFQDLRHRGEYPPREDFLTHYTWPVDQDGRPVQWSRLPVIDKAWRRSNLPERHQTKGGFIQEATGWKPSPMQSYVNVSLLARAARLETS